MIDFEKPPVWEQVKDFRMGELEKLDYYGRYRLMHALGREYSGNLLPSDEASYTRLLHQEDMLRNLFFIDSLEPVQYSEDAEALERFNQDVIDSGLFENWKQQWARRDSLAQRGVFLQIARKFGDALGVDLRVRDLKLAATEIVNAEVDLKADNVILNNSRETELDFMKAYHSMVYACARLYQEKLLSGDIRFDEGSDREDLAWRTFGDLSPVRSMMWEGSGFNNFMMQPTRRHAMWLADGALDSLAAAYDPDRQDELRQQIHQDMRDRYLSHKVLYATSMPVYAAEDVWNTLSPIFTNDIRGLSLEAQTQVVRLASKMHQRGEAVPRQLDDSIEKILDSYPLTDAYKLFQIEKQRELLYEMSMDDKVLDAWQNWHEYDQYQRLRFLQHVVDIHADVFGCRRSRIEPVDIPPKIDPETHKKYIEYGGYKWRKAQSTISINVNEESGTLDYFFEALNTAIHEAQHGLQDHLAREYERGSLKQDDPLYEQARYFNVGSYVYVHPDQNRTHYHNNLLERDAFALGNGVSFYFGLANNEQRHEYARRMRALSKDPAKHDLDISRGFPNAPWHEQPRMPEPEA